MKNLINKISRNLVLSLAVAFGVEKGSSQILTTEKNGQTYLVIGCDVGQGLDLETEKKLKNFNKKTKQIYKDFKRFIKEEGNPEYYRTILNLKKVYRFDYKSPNLLATFYPFFGGLVLESGLEKGDYMLTFDKKTNGLTINKDNCCKLKPENDPLGENTKSIYQKENALALASEYAISLIEIMREGGHPKYQK